VRAIFWSLSEREGGASEPDQVKKIKRKTGKQNMTEEGTSKIS